MVERCAWCSLITMHYFTRIYSASVVGWAAAAWAGSLNTCVPFCSWPWPAGLIKATDRKKERTKGRKKDERLPHPCVTTESVASVLLLEGYLVLFFFLFSHSEVVKMCKHHGHGTVTHWPTSTKENFVCLIKHTHTHTQTHTHTRKEQVRGEGGRECERGKGGERNTNYWFM